MDGRRYSGVRYSLGGEKLENNCRPAVELVVNWNSVLLLRFFFKLFKLKPIFGHVVALTQNRHVLWTRENEAITSFRRDRAQLWLDISLKRLALQWTECPPAGFAISHLHYLAFTTHMYLYQSFIRSVNQSHNGKQAKWQNGTLKHCDVCISSLDLQVITGYGIDQTDKNQWLKWGESGGGLSPPAPIWAPCNSMSPPDWIYRVILCPYNAKLVGGVE